MKPTVNRLRLLLIFMGALSLIEATILKASDIAAIEPGEEYSGGDTTIFDDTRAAFSMRDRNLSSAHRTAFFVGHSFFNDNWVAAGDTVKSRSGLGPLFVNRSCSACHFKDGRSEPLRADLALETMVGRISIPGTNSCGGPKSVPGYGIQLQTQALPRVPPEAGIMVRFENVDGKYGDGEAYTLRRPVFTITNLAYGPMPSDVMVSPVAAPSVFGVGLLEAIPEETLRRLAENESERDEGISGKINWVWDLAASRFAPGRFGWKAEQPTIAQQCAAAFNEDMGLTTEMIPKENYTDAEIVCATMPSGEHPEVSHDIFNDVVVYCHTLAVPARRDWTNAVVLRGKRLFSEINCAACHEPDLETGDLSGYPELSKQTIHPYTDLLLHDMGDGLADHRQVYLATGSEWRTAPLWGIGLVKTVNNHTLFLHDGRARNLAEAILWHGGEAERSKERFRQLDKTDRDALIAFLDSL
jgi:CxxC motif-containing protein (DUF1111 family)